MSEFKWRGGQVTRIEALTDAVFGFAITFLFVSFDVPTDYDALVVQLKGFVPFAACFALLIMVWMYHYQLFGRFDLDDGIAMFLNSILLFVVLFYIYPLKFVFTSWLSRSTTFSSWDQVGSMMALYAAGFVAVFLFFGLMYAHALRRRRELKMTEADVFFALEHLYGCGIMVAVGVISLILSQTVPIAWAAPVAGFTYFAIGPAQWYRMRWMARNRSRLTSAWLATEVVAPEAT